MTQRMALTLTEVSLLAAREAAETPSFEEVYAQHFRGVWRTLRRLGVADAVLDDAAQDVFVVVHRKLSSFRGGSARAWLYAIAVRVASDYRRGSARRPTAPLDDEVADLRADPSRTSEVSESVRLLHQLLEQLDDKKRTVFVLSELEQLSVVEIAEALSINLNTAYSRLRAARSEFETALVRHRRREAGR